MVPIVTVKSFSTICYFFPRINALLNIFQDVFCIGTINGVSCDDTVTCEQSRVLWETVGACRSQLEVLRRIYKIIFNTDSVVNQQP